MALSTNGANPPLLFKREKVSPDAACNFLGHTQWLVNYWLLQNAFSIGIGDTIADAATMEKINETISKAKNEVKDLITKAQSKSLEAEPGRTMMFSFENKVNRVCLLGFVHNDAGSSAQKNLSESNNLKAMVTAGSKGSFINISQMTACVGQQNVEYIILVARRRNLGADSLEMFYTWNVHKDRRK